jgi:membrane protein implicated in regulation of membrane protease activity
MTWADFYLVCFLVGFLLSVVSLVAGGAHIHIPHVHVPHFDIPHLHIPHVHGPEVGGDVPVFNLGTIAAFLAWFGGTGFLLVQFSSLWAFLALGLAFASGLAGAAVIFFFLAKVLMREDEEREEESEDTDMIGVLGHLSLPIREGGTGELVYTQGGTRHCTAARSEDGAAIEKGAEVVATRYEKGVAYVRRWEDLAGGEGEASQN